jgi:hypothetical protein
LYKSLVLYKKLLGTSVLLFVVFLAFGQVKRYTLSGQILDVEKQAIIGASIVLLNPIDSVMIAFGSSDVNGNFKIKNVKQQSVKLQLTYIGYGTLEKILKIEGDSVSINLGTITMMTDENLLKEVVVKGEYVPIQIKKDTVEYNADAYRVRPNASVEELLKKLPGIEVDASGTITAQGEEVKRVTVDGKKFFGNDAKMATQNLPADAVKKIQVIDKKSEKAEFSGISDGESEKIINLQLKDNKKIGTFGDVAAGVGTSKRFESKLSLNKFNSKYQASLLGNFNNLSNQGFSFNDYNSLMSGSGFGGGGNSNNVVNFGNNNNGRIKSATLGLNTYYEFSPKFNVGASYFLTNSNQDLLKDKISQNFLAEQNFLSSDALNSISKKNGHNINLNIRIKPDSFHRVDIESSVKINDSNIKSSLIAKNTSSDGSRIINENNQKDTTLTNLNDISFRGVLNKRMRKPGRIFTLETSYGTTENEQDYDIESYKKLFGNNQIESLIQDQIALSDNKNYRIYSEYKEPLGNKNYIGLSYSRRNYNSNQDKDFYNIDPIVQSRLFNDSLSNYFRNDINYNRVSLLYTKDNENYAFSADLAYQRSMLKGENDKLLKPINNPYNYFLPALTFNWIDKGIRIRYNTNVSEPTVTQLQPIVDNSNPLNIYRGNPNLRPEYAHSINIRYNFFDNFNFVNFFTFINLRYTKDKIVTAQSFSPNLVRESSPINTTSNQNASINFTYSAPIKKLKVKTRIFSSGSISKGINFINNQENEVTTLSPKISFDLENIKNSVVSLLGGYDLSYSENKYSKNMSNNNNFITHGLRSVLLINFGKGFSLDGDINHTIYSKERFGENNTLTLANAGFSKRLFNDRLTAKLKIADIFNVGQGISRSASETSLEEVITNSIGRYTMFTLTYRLSAFNPQANGGGRDGRDVMRMMR